MGKLQYGWNPKNVQKSLWPKASRHRGPSFGTILKRAAAAERRAQRQAVQRHHQLLKQQAQIAKMEERERAAYEVQVFENHLERLTSVHQECAEICNWNVIAQEPPPTLPVRANVLEKLAQDALSQYHPGFFDRLFRQEEKRRGLLQQYIQTARQQDEDQYQEALQTHIQDQSEWLQQCEQANLILKGEWQAYLDVISEAKPFSDVEEPGSRLGLARGQQAEIIVTLHVNSDQVVPSEIKSLLKSGKLSVKKMPQGRFNDLCQDYVCGCVFRVARELFALLPVNLVVVHCYGNLFDSSTGHTTNECLLSAAMPRSEIEYLNFDMLDPSGALQAFVHRMNFKKTQGFTPVAPLYPNEY